MQIRRTISSVMSEEKTDGCAQLWLPFRPRDYDKIGENGSMDFILHY